MIERLDRRGAVTYTIESLSYDLKGQLLESRSPAGNICYTYDLLSRMVKVDSPHFSCELSQFDPAGSLLKLKQRDPSGIIDAQYTYDRLNYLTDEHSHKENQYAYDSLGNCLFNNEQQQQINLVNQITHNGTSEFSYDPSGNLKQETTPHCYYEYDALNRLISCEKEGKRTGFVYDAFGRCIEMCDESGSKKLLYQGEQEIGSLLDGNLHEFRLVHPDDRYDMTFATEINGQTFFPVQDTRCNICALEKTDGTLAEWSRFSAFDSKEIMRKMPPLTSCPTYIENSIQ